MTYEITESISGGAVSGPGSDQGQILIESGPISTASIKFEEEKLFRARLKTFWTDGSTVIPNL